MYKVKTDEDIKSDFEAIAACILPYNHVANNKAYSHKNEKHNAYDASIEITVGDRDR